MPHAVITVESAVSAGRAKQILEALPISEVEEIFGSVMYSRKEISQRRIQQVKAKLQHEAEDKIRRKLEVRAERARAQQTEPLRILRSFYAAIHGERQDLNGYTKYTTKSLLELLDSVRAYSPDKEIHRKIKPRLIQWLKERIVVLSAEKHNEPLLKRLKDTLRITGTVK